MVYDITKADWKLFQEKLPDWQENFMRKLNYEYMRVRTKKGFRKVLGIRKENKIR